MFVTRSQLLVRPIGVLRGAALDDEDDALAPSPPAREHANVACEATIAIGVTSVNSFASMKRARDLELDMIATLYLFLVGVTRGEQNATSLLDAA